MITLRALLFNILFYALTAANCLLMIPLLGAPRRWVQWCGTIWCRQVRFALDWVVGLRLQVVGGEHLPDGPCIVVAKHQSAFETVVFHTVLANPVYVLKKELTRIPLFGRYLVASGQVAVDRSAGASALKSMVDGVGKALASGRQVIIFPEGTRTPPGTERAFHPGIYALYKAFPETPIVPMALNSGMFWGRHRFVKYPGTVTFEFLPPMPPGLERKAFMAEIKARINDRSQALSEEAARMYPQTARRIAQPRAPGA